jgi:hypothetical protein
LPGQNDGTVRPILEHPALSMTVNVPACLPIFGKPSISQA